MLMDLASSLLVCLLLQGGAQARIQKDRGEVVSTLRTVADNEEEPQVACVSSVKRGCAVT